MFQLPDNLSNVPLIISVVLAVCIFIVLLYAFSLLKKKQDQALLKKKVQRSADTGWSSTDASALRTASSDAGDEVQGLKGSLNKLGALLSDKSDERQSAGRLRFLRAGFRGKSVYNTFWGFKILFLVLAVLLAALMVSQFFVARPLGTKLFIVLIAAYLGFYGPDLWLKLVTKGRQNEIVLGFPDALDLLVVCVEAGLGLESAIYRVSQEMKYKNKPISDEFELYNLEISAGKSRKDALRNMGDRINSYDVYSFITLLIQTDKLGTSVSKALRVYSDTFRSKRFSKAEEKAAKLTVKLIFPLILFIFPSIFVVVMGPAVIKIMELFEQM